MEKGTQQKLSQLYQFMQTDPSYASMPYEEQLKARKIVTERIAVEDPTFSQLSPEAQQMAVNSLSLSARPVWSDPESEKMFEGDLQVIESGKATKGYSRSLGVVKNTLGGSLLALAARPVIRAIETGVDFAMNKIYGKDIPDQYMIGNLMKAYTGTDGDKLIAYANNKFWQQDNEEAQRALRTGEMTGSMIAVIGDFALMKVATGGKVALKVGKVGKAFAKRHAGSLATWVGKVGIPATAEGIASGTYGLVREQVFSIVNSDDERRQDSLRKVGKTFGEWAVADFLFSLAIGSALPFIGGVFGRAFGKAKAKKYFARSPKETQELIDMAIGGAIPPELASQLDPSYLRYIKGEAQKTIAANRLSDGIRLSPYDDLALRANDGRMNVYRDPETGAYSVFGYEKESGAVIETIHEDIIGAKRRISKRLYERLDDLSGEAKKQFIARNKNMLQYRMNELSIDGVYDPMKVKGQVGPKEYDVLKRKRTSVSDDFVSPIDRPYIGGNEAAKIEAAFNGKGYVKRMKVNIPEENLAAMREGGELFNKRIAVDMKNVDDGTEVFVMVKRPAPAQAVNEASVLAKRAIANGASDSEDILTSMYLMEAGYDGALLKGGIVRTFYPDKIKIIATKFDPTTGKLGNITTVAKSDPALSGYVRREYRAQMGAAAFAQNERFVTEAALKIKGDIKGKDVEDLTRMVLKGKGIDTDGLKVKVSSAVDAAAEGEQYMVSTLMSKSKNEIVLTVPKKISSAKAQRQFLRELFGEELPNIIETMGKGQAAKMKVPRITKGTAAVYKSPFKGVKQTEAWLRSAVEDIAKGSFSKTANGYRVKLPGRTEILSKSISELTDKVMLEALDPAYLKLDMAKRGYRLTVKNNTITVRGEGLSEPVTGNSINEVLDALNYRPEKLSKEFAPEVTIVKNGVNVEYSEGAMVGSKRSIRKVLAQFEDIDFRSKSKHIRSTKDGDISFTPRGDYEVRIPEAGIIENFPSAQQATKYLRGVMKDFDQLQDVAKRKGLQIVKEGQGYKVNNGADSFLVKDRDELIRVLADHPDTTGGKSLLSGDLNAEELNMIDEVLYNFEKNKLPNFESVPVRPLGDITVLDTGDAMVPLGSKGEIRALFSNMDAWAEAELPKMGHKDILQRYRQLEVSRRLVETEVNKVEDAIRAIFSDENGKLIDIKQRKKIYYHAGARTAEDQVKAIANYGELTGDEQKVIANLRRLLGDAREGGVSGLAGLFDLDPNLVLDQYMPRIKDWAAKHADEVSKMSTAEELIEAAARDKHGHESPKQLKAFFKNMRTSEALSFDVIDDPIKALQHYVRVGMRQKYMGRAWEELYGALGKGGVDLGVIHRFNRYRDAVMGMAGSDGRNTAKRIGEALGRELKIKNGGNMTDAFFSLNYLSNMGLRPWLAIRNSFQVFTTLAPRMGNMWVDDAIKAVSGFTDADYTYLQRVGVISREPPLVNTILDAETSLGSITRKSLGRFKSSDEYTRAVAYMTASKRFDFAMDKWNKGGVKDIDGFLKEAGVTKFDEDTINTVRRLVEKGDLDSINGAKNYFGNKLVRETMFDYTKVQAPTLYTGSFWGEIFGQYGTYAAGYRANIARGLKHGSIGDKAAFVARFLTNTTALYTAFSALKIKADNFKPWTPALFGGGPSFELAVAALQSFNTGYKGQQARSEVGRKLSPVVKKEGELRLNYPELLPGSTHLHYYKRAAQYFADGDPWRGFLSMTTTPVTDPDD